MNPMCKPECSGGTVILSVFVYETTGTRALSTYANGLQNYEQQGKIGPREALFVVSGPEQLGEKQTGQDIWGEYKTWTPGAWTPTWPTWTKVSTALLIIIPMSFLVRLFILQF